MNFKWIITAGFCIVIAAIAIPRFYVNRDLPENLHGVWETTAAKYEDRNFLLDRNALGYGTGGWEITWYEITRVDKVIQDNKTLYTIEYQNDEGAVFKKALYYESINGGVITFENQASIKWTLVDRKDSSSTEEK